jgi:hypothetical protein
MVICPEASCPESSKQKNENVRKMLNKKGRKATGFICDITIKTPFIR